MTASPAAWDVGVVRIAVLHPLRAWVDGLETVLASYCGLQVVTARTTMEWVRPAITGGGVDLLVLGLHDRPDVRAGPDLVVSLRDTRPDLAVVAICDAEDPDSLAAAVRAGVRGWVKSDDSVDHLADVIHGVAKGDACFPPRLMSAVIDGLLAAERSQQDTAAVLAPLSSREIDMLRCLGQGLTRHEIAALYVLSPHTVRTHINNLLRKLDVHSTLAAVSLARQAGLCQPAVALSRTAVTTNAPHDGT